MLPSIAFIVTHCVLASATPTPVEIRSFLGDYEKAVAKIEDVYNRLDGEIVVRNTFKSPVLEDAPGFHVKFALCGPFRRLERHSVGSMAQIANYDLALGKNSRYAFALDNEAPDKDFRVSNLEENLDTSFSFDVEISKYLFAPLAMEAIPLRDILFQKEINISSIQSIEDMVEVTFSFPGKTPFKNIRSGKVLFDVKNGYVARRSEMAVAGKGNITVISDVTFGSHRIQDIPLPTEVIVDIRAIGEHSVCKVLHLEPCTRDESYFTLSAFGLPEPGIKAPDRSVARNKLFWINVIAIVALLALLLRRRMRRRDASALQN